MIAAGATDQAIAARLGGVSRMAVSRHWHNHVVAPAKALAAAAGKGQDVAAQRAGVMAAAEAGDPAAFVTLAGIVSDLRRVHDRLERAADGAEQGRQPQAVASLSAQQLRAAEVRAKIGGVGGHGPGKAGPDAGGAGVFSVNIHFGGGVTERISTTGGVVEGELVQNG